MCGCALLCVWGLGQQSEAYGGGVWGIGGVGSGVWLCGDNEGGGLARLGTVYRG